MTEELSIKEKLLRAATKVFAEDGFAAASIRKIAREAGVNSSMISYHFGGKQGLYKAVIGAEFAAVSDFASRDFTKVDPREVIRAYAEEVFTLHRTHPEMLIFIYQELIKPAGEESLFRWVSPQAGAIVTEALTRGMREGIFRADLNVPAAVLALSGMVAFHFYSHSPSGQGLPPALWEIPEEDYVRQATEIFLRGIVAETEAADL